MTRGAVVLVSCILASFVNVFDLEHLGIML